MLTVPDKVQTLFAQDSISKNFRVHFPNGEFRDLVNKDFVSESVVFTEAISSDAKIKFGQSESSSIEFSTYFDKDLKGCVIFCEIEIDITALGWEFILEYGSVSPDVPYPFYPVPYGYFVVNSCVLGDNDISSVIGYQNNLTDKSLQLLYNDDLSEFTKIKMMIGASYIHTSNTPLTGAFSEISMLELLLASYPSISTFFGNSYMARYDKDSPVFNYRAVGSPWTDYTDKLVDEDAQTPVLKTFVVGREIMAPDEGHGYNRLYFIYVRGKKIIFDDDKINWHICNYLRAPIGNNATRVYPQGVDYPDDVSKFCTPNSLYDDLPYTLSSDYFYELSYDNTKLAPSRDDFRYPEIYDKFIKDNFEYLASPCIMYKEKSNRPTSTMYMESSPQAINVNYLFPNSVLSTDEYEWDCTYTRPKLYLGYLGLDDEDRNPIAIATVNEDFVNIAPSRKSGTTNIINIFPKLFDISEASPNVESSKIWKEYYEAQNDVASSSYGNTWVKHKRHIEVGIPTEIVIVSIADSDNPFKLYDSNGVSCRHLPTTYIPDVSYDTQTIQINDFLNPTLDQYAFDDTGMFNPTIRLPLELGTIHSDTPEYTMPLGVYNYLAQNNPRPSSGRETVSLDSYIVSNVSQYFTNYNAISDFAEINGLLVKTDRYALNHWKFVKYTVPELIYPDDELYPDDDLYPRDANFITRTDWRRIFHGRKIKHPYNKVICKVNNITYEAEVIDVSEDEESEYESYDISDNWFITSGIIVDIQEVVDYLAETLKSLGYYELNMTMRGLPQIEAGDALMILTKTGGLNSLNARQRIKGIQSLITDVENH